VIGGIKRRLDGFLSARKVEAALRHVSGPTHVPLADGAAGAVIFAQDAAFYLRDCLDHHFALGAAHAVVIDAGSTDQTAAIAKAEPRVTLMSSRLPVSDLGSAIRTAAARRIFQGGWVLFAEPDEMVAPPADLPRLLDYANALGFTAILGQYLDMAEPAGPLAERYADARAASRYTLQGLEWVPYGDPSFHLDWFTRDNPAPDPGVRMSAGGLRKLVFGEDPVLIKHVLVRNRPGIDLMSHPHCASNVAVADVTVAIRRYMFAGDWQARDRASVAAGLWEHGEDRKRLGVAAKPGFQVILPDPQVWSGTNALLSDGFLYASARARTALGLP
jgi:glycosyltransferase involved in cell wall biosynthesis